MKLAILSDFHLGYERFENDALAQSEQAVRKACELADFILVAGDVFDSKTPKQEILASAIRLFQIPAGKGIRVAAIHGTHERRIKSLVNPVQLLSLAGLVENAHLSTIVFEKNGEKLAVQGLGGVPEEYASVALKEKKFEPVPGAFNIFMFHQSVKELHSFSEDFMGLEDLPKGFDLYVNGHIHRRNHLPMGKAKLLLPGSTVVTQMKKEETGAKGFFIFETKTGKEEFIEIPTRPFFFDEVPADGSGIEELFSKVRKKVEELAGKAPNPLIRVRVTGSLAQGFEPSNVDFRSIEKSFEGKAFVEIDSDLASTALSDKIALLRELRQKKMSVKEMGLELLKEKLKKAKIPASKVEEFFEVLQGDPEEALKKILGD